MSLEEYLSELENAKIQILHFQERDFEDKAEKMFNWILYNGKCLIGEQIETYQTPLWNVNYTKNNQFVEAIKDKRKKKSTTLSDFIRHFDQDLDLLLRQVKGLIDRK